MGTKKENYSKLERRSFLPPQTLKKLTDSHRLELGNPKERLVLMHSPMGVRISYSIDRGHIELWISPQAKKSVDYRLRNFSNRDDHTAIFDRIYLPGCDSKNFLKCDYDPFHSVLHYTDQRVHLVSLVNEPAILLWFEKDDYVDLKSDKQDIPIERSETIFAMHHPDRGFAFEFAAVVSSGAGAFMHRKAVDQGRSIYTRIQLHPEQPILIGGELEGENIMERLKMLAKNQVTEIVKSNEQTIAQETNRANVTFRNNTQWQKQYDFNKRVLFSSQDYSGAVPAALRVLYYLIWHIDGTITSVGTAHSGWVEFLERWTRFELSNPTETETPLPGKFFGQLVNGKISKQEEWGLYFASLSAFYYWTQTGSRIFCEGEYKKVLLEVLDWNERYTYDPERNAFGRFYIGENPLFESHDFGWDDAVGRPMAGAIESFSKLPIMRNYSFRANHEMYNTYLMLAAMFGGEEQDAFVAKAQRLIPFLSSCKNEDNSVASGYYLLEDGSYVKNLAPTSWTPLCPFHFDAATYIPIITKNPVVAMEEIKNGGERFAHQVLIHLVARDPSFLGSEDAETFLSVFIPQCQRTGAYLQMPGTVPENVNCPDGTYHDNRPQLFSTGLMQALFVSRGLFRLPFGVALRANPYLESIRNFAYIDGALDVTFENEGDRIEHIEIDGKTLHCSLQIPDKWVQKETNIKVIQGTKSSVTFRLISSTLRLLDVSTDNDACTFVVHAYGKNELCFNREPDEWKIVGSNGSKVSGTCRHIIDHWWLEFDGVGEFSLEIR